MSRSSGLKRVGATQYKYVSEMIQYVGTKLGATVFNARIPKLKHNSYHQEIHAAAKRVDMVLIEHGQEPVNVLVKK